jgi:cytochrome c biogenesis protein CcdA/glutaredoxin
MLREPEPLKRAALAIVALAILLVAVPAFAETGNPVHAYVFKSATCPHCQAQRPWMEALDRAAPEFEAEFFEIVATREHHDMLRRMAAAHDVTPGSVPMAFIGGRVWVGDSPQIRNEIEDHVARCIEQACPDSLALSMPDAEQDQAESKAASVINIPLLGTVDLSYQPLLLSTAIIAFVDGFNPCSLWLLSILIALVLHSGSRKRVMIVGLTFLTITAAIYGMFMVGVFSVLAYASFLPWMYWIVAGFALVFGLVNVKDYFYFKKGLSFTISDKHKPGIFRNFRELMTNGKSPLALAGATAVMASGIALIELPCTAGFPVIWSGLVSSHEVGAWGFAMLLAVYLVIYLLDELIVFGVAVVKLRIDRFEERHARILKLIGGVVMVALAIVLITEPEIMSNAGQAMAVFALAFLVSALIVFVDRKLVTRLSKSEPEA